MRFTLEQSFDAAPDAVAAAYADPALYEAFGELPRAGQPVVLSFDDDGTTTTLEVRWAFTAHLSPAARAVIDPHRLTWVERSRHDLAARTVTFRLIPDHYGDRFSCEGSYRFVDDGSGGTVRHTEGELRVKAPLVGRAAEHAILDGLADQFQAEVRLVEQFVKS